MDTPMQAGPVDPSVQPQGAQQQPAAPPPTFSSITTSPAWAGMDDGRKNRVLDAWKDAVISHGRQNVQGFDDAHAAQIEANVSQYRQKSGLPSAPHMAPIVGETEMRAVPEGTGGVIREAGKAGIKAVRESLSPILGPTDEQKWRESVPFGKEKDGTVHYEYKPLGSEIDKIGLAPAIAEFVNAAIPANKGEVFPRFPKQQSVALQVGASVANSMIGVGEYIASPQGALGIATGKSWPGIGKAIAGAFSYQMASELPTQYKEFSEAKTTPDKADAAVKLAFTSLFAFGGVLHATEGAKKLSTENQKDVISQVPTDVLAKAAADPDFKNAAPDVHKNVTEELSSRNVAPEAATQIAAATKANDASVKAENVGATSTADAASEAAKKIAQEAVDTQSRAPEQPAAAAAPERIVAAQFTNPETGEKTSGPSHVEAAKAQGVDAPQEASMRETPDFGFETSTGRTVTREEAAKIAQDAGQVKEGVDATQEGHKLHSNEVDYGKGVQESKVGTEVQTGEQGAAKAPDATTGAPDGKAETKAVTAPEGGVQNKLDAPEGYTGGPGAMGPKEAAEMESAAKASAIGIKNADVDAQREKRGQPPLMSAARKAYGTVWDSVMDKVDSVPEYAKGIIDSINNGTKSAINDFDQAAILHEEIRLRNERHMEVQRINDPHETQENREAARVRLAGVEQDLYDAEAAGGKAGTLAGQALAIRRMMIREDYTLDSVLERASAANKGPLNDEQRIEIERLVEEVAGIEKIVDISKNNADEVGEIRASQAAVDGIVKDIAINKKLSEVEPAKATPDAPKYSKRVLEIAEKIVTKWEKAADAADKRMLARLGHANLPLGPEQVAQIADMALVIRGYLGRKGLNFAETSAAMIKRFGEAIKPFLQQAWDDAHLLIDKEEINSDVRSAARAGVRKKGEKTPSQAKASLEANALAGDELNHRMVYDLARAHIVAGVKGENDVMRAVHNDVKEFFPDATERDVRRAFSEYGKAKFPSSEATSQALSEMRTLVQTQESIDRLRAGEPALRSGMQRNPTTPDIREKKAELSALLKKYSGQTSEKQLKTNMEARERAVSNRIEDLNKQIETLQKGGKLPEKVPPPEPSPALKVLIERKEALETKLQELKNEKNPPKTEDDKKVDAIEKQQEKLRAIIDSGKLPDKKLGKPTVDTKEVAAAKEELAKLQEQVDDIRRAQNPPKTDAEKQIDELSRTKAKLDEKLASGNLESVPKSEFTPLSATAKQLHDEIKGLRDILAQKKKDAKPGNTPEGRREAAQIKALERAIQNYEVNTEASDFGNAPSKTKLGPDTERVSRLKDLLKARKGAYESAEQAQLSVRTPTEKYNEQRVKQIQKQLAEAERIQRENDYEKKQRPAPKEKFEDTKKLEIDLVKKKQEIKDKIYQIEMDRRSKFMKATSFAKQYVRASVLLRLSVFEHLGGAAVENIVTSPVNSAAAQLLRFTKTTDAIRKKAGYYGEWGGQMTKLMGSVSLGAMKAAIQKLRTGKSDLDWMHSDGKTYPKEFQAWVGHTHAMIKEPIRQGVYARAMELGVKAAKEQGLDPINDKVLRQAISNDAFQIANAEIFMADNFITSAFHKRAAATLRANKINPEMGAFVADVMGIMMPVVNVPTNIAIRTFQLNPVIGLGNAARHLYAAHKRGDLANGAEKLSARDAQLITRAFSYGMVGLALSAVAWEASSSFGGTYPIGSDLRRNDRGGLKPGEIRIGNLTIPAGLLHGPVGTWLNIVADSRRVYDQAIAQGDSPYAALTAAEAFALFQPLKGIPLLKMSYELLSPYKTSLAKVGENFFSRVIPGILSEAAKWADGHERTVKTFSQSFEAKVPILRKRVPLKKESGGGMSY